MTLAVLSVASEMFPFVKTGGLADVVGALPSALEDEDVAVRTLLPGYPAVLAALSAAEPVREWPALQGGEARLLAGHAAGLHLAVLDAPHLFARPGGPYGGLDGEDWVDNALRFAALAEAGAALGLGLVPALRPDVIHAHDWQAGLVPAYLHYREGTPVRSVMTVHNLAFPGKFPASILPQLGLPPSAYALDGVEFYGTVSLLKAGLQFADRITTVSPGYAAEIRTTAYGMGFEGLLRARSAVVSGILNGIDTEQWNPIADPHLVARYDIRRLNARLGNTAAVRERFGLASEARGPLFGVVSRLTWQKGIDLLLAALPAVLASEGQLAILGSGEPEIEAGIRGSAAAHPRHIACVTGYDEALAHRMQGGVDALLVPSRFEPCGLTQLCALRYGAVPVVARVGGLADTVIDAGPMALAAGVATGVQFPPAGTEMLETAIERTAALFRDRAQWRRLQRNGMRTDVSWRGPAHSYAALYRELTLS